MLRKVSLFIYIPKIEGKSLFRKLGLYIYISKLQRLSLKVLKGLLKYFHMCCIHFKLEAYNEVKNTCFKILKVTKVRIH